MSANRIVKLIGEPPDREEWTVKHARLVEQWLAAGTGEVSALDYDDGLLDWFGGASPDDPLYRLDPLGPVTEVIVLAYDLQVRNDELPAGVGKHKDDMEEGVMFELSDLPEGTRAIRVFTSF